MKKIETLKIGIVALLCIASLSSVRAQGDTLKATAELVSSYVWRGSLATSYATPNFQPTIAYGMKCGLEIGVWGSTDFVGSYKEVDPYVSYTKGSLKFTFTDYNWNFARANYFDYKASETGHMFEGSIGYTGPSVFPLSISWNTIFYGFDKKIDDASKNAYSTYIELGYTKGAASFFFGLTPWKSYYTAYSKDFAIVNIGATVSRSIPFTDKFSLPVRATLVVNPAASYTKSDYAHLVFGITF